MGPAPLAVGENRGGLLRIAQSAGVTRLSEAPWRQPATPSPVAEASMEGRLDGAADTGGRRGSVRFSGARGSGARDRTGFGVSAAGDGQRHVSWAAGRTMGADRRRAARHGTDDQALRGCPVWRGLAAGGDYPDAWAYRPRRCAADAGG